MLIVVAGDPEQHEASDYTDTSLLCVLSHITFKICTFSVGRVSSGRLFCTVTESELAICPSLRGLTGVSRSLIEQIPVPTRCHVLRKVRVTTGAVVNRYILETRGTLPRGSLLTHLDEDLTFVRRPCIYY